MNPDNIKQQITPSPTSFYMVLGPNGSPTMRHANYSLAQAEAARLARANQGKEFFVLQAVSRLETAPATVNVVPLANLPIWR
jgi:hypothetical protein